MLVSQITAAGPNGKMLVSQTTAAKRSGWAALAPIGAQLSDGGAL
jgi:hypothetical protein